MFTVRGSGADIWGSADAFHFRSAAGTFTGIAARVLDVSDTNPWTKAGVMFRKDLTPGSEHVALIATPGKGVAMQYRARAGGASTQIADVAGTAPKWLRLLKDDAIYIGQVSNDGVAWTEIGRVTTSMTAFPVAGLAVTSHDNSATATAAFDDVVTNPSGGCECWGD